MRKRAGVMAALLASTALLVAAAPAAQATVCAYNSCSTAIQSWGAVKVCDGDADGNAVASNYYRDQGPGKVIVYSGKGTCEQTANYQTDKIYRHQAQQIRDFAPDAWSSWEYRY
ncbi:hypothetical protein ACWGHM_39645 [Streptomyces sp. NPDC054904]|uniref:hypothetical protein n=1 Tax=Streptomyces sp. NPDC090054 TaxID=3365933 RepID=UPI0037F3558C